MKISILVASFKRPTFLAECLNALSQQERLPDEVVVIVRDIDTETQDMLAQFPNPFPSTVSLKITQVTEPGIVKAENQGLRVATGHVVCLIDDDAVALQDWLKRIEQHYQDMRVGAVGGPTVPFVEGAPVLETTSAPCHQKTWYGAHIGNSERIPTSIREVQVLRGCNMSFRRHLGSQFDEQLKPYWRRFEDDMILGVFRQGYKVIYDPAIQVYHHTAPVKDVKTRDSDPETIQGSHHNNTYVMLKHNRLFRQTVFLAFTFLIGDRTNPGFLGYLAKAIIKKRYKANAQEGLWAFRGKCAGIRTFFLWKQNQP